jgi:DNA-binding FrmR family transcriptional regulator
MTKASRHESHPLVAKRLKRANGHLAGVINMIEEGRPCVEIAQQLFAVERAIAQAKRVLIQDHIDYCLDAALEERSGSSARDTSEFKEIVKYL